MSRSSVLKTLFSDFESHSFSHRNSKTREDLWATYACAKRTFWETDEKTKRGGHFQIEIWLKKSAWLRKHFLGVISETGL